MSAVRAGSKGGPSATSSRTPASAPDLQGHDHGCTPPRGAAKAGKTVGDLLDDSGTHSGAGDEIPAVCPLHDERRPIVEAVCTTTPDAQTQDLLVAELPANGRPVALATCKVKSSRAER